MLRFRVAYHIGDYNAEQAETGLTLVDVSSISALDTFTIAQEPVYQALSDGHIRSALAYAKRPPAVDKPLSGQASVYRRLLVLFTDGLKFGSMVIPAPRADLDYETTGPYAGVKIAAGPSPTATALDNLMAALAPTLLPDGTPFPVGQWQAAIMSDP